MKGNSPPGRNIGDNIPGFPGIPPDRIPPEDIRGGYIIMPDRVGAMPLVCDNTLHDGAGNEIACGGIMWALMGGTPINVKYEEVKGGKPKVNIMPVGNPMNPQGFGAMCLECGAMLSILRIKEMAQSYMESQEGAEDGRDSGRGSEDSGHEGGEGGEKNEEKGA